MPRRKATIVSSTGHNLTVMEDKFISEYIELGNITQAVVNAGYKSKTPAQYGQSLLKKDYIQDEIDYRLSTLKSQRIADATEIMEYFSSVMRGEITDQFGLEASLSERTKAAQELAKRQIDMVNKAKEVATPELKISLDFSASASEKPLQTMKDVMGDTKELSDMVANLLSADAKEQVAEIVSADDK